MKSFKEFYNNKINESDIGIVEPGLDNGDERDSYHFNNDNEIIIHEDHKNYKLTKQDKKDIKDLFEAWENLSYNVNFELSNFEDKNIYNNDIAYYRMVKVRKLLPVIEEMRKIWNKRY